MNVIVLNMAKISAPETFEQVLAPLLDTPEGRALWYETALARAISRAVVGYRTTRGLTQTALGVKLGMPQAQISRIEAGDHTPTLETLLRIADALQLNISLSIRPRADAAPRRPAARPNATIEATDQLVISISAASGDSPHP